MRLLLDTQILLWFLAGDRRLPAGWQATIVDPLNAVHLSVASIWEAVIKHAIGKLPFPEAPHSLLPRECQEQNISLLPVTLATVTQVAVLPPLHRDPFDRAIVATANEHRMTLLSVDAQVRAYPVALLPLTP